MHTDFFSIRSSSDRCIVFLLRSFFRVSMSCFPHVLSTHFDTAPVACYSDSTSVRRRGTPFRQRQTRAGADRRADVRTLYRVSVGLAFMGVWNPAVRPSVAADAVVVAVKSGRRGNESTTERRVSQVVRGIYRVHSVETSKTGRETCDVYRTARMPDNRGVFADAGSFRATAAAPSLPIPLGLPLAHQFATLARRRNGCTPRAAFRMPA